MKTQNATKEVLQGFILMVMVFSLMFLGAILS